MTDQAQRGQFFTRDDLRNFDAESKDLILRAQTYGWTGRIGTRGHAFMYAPDGKNTMSVSRDSMNARAGKNQAAKFERWLKDFERAKASAFGEIQTEADIDHIPELAPGVRAPIAMIAEMKRSLHDFFLDGGFLSSPDVVLGSAVKIDEILEKPRTWYVFETKPTPHLVAHGSQIDEFTAWESFYRDYPQHLGPLTPPENEEIDEMKMYLCPDCDKQFEKESSLKAHRLTHNQVPHNCPICGKEFKNQGAVNLHTAVKHGEPKTCEICGFRAATAGSLKLHQNSKHQGGAAVRIEDVPVTSDPDYIEPKPAAVTSEDVAVTSPVTRAIGFTYTAPVGAAAQDLVTQMRALVAPELMTELDSLRAEVENLREQNAKLVKQAGDWEAGLAMLKEAMNS